MKIVLVMGAEKVANSGLIMQMADLVVDENGKVLKDRSGCIKSVSVDHCTFRNLIEAD